MPIMPRRASTTMAPSLADDGPEQELGSMYDYLAKIILIGPSGSGKYAQPEEVAPRLRP